MLSSDSLHQGLRTLRQSAAEVLIAIGLMAVSELLYTGLKGMDSVRLDPISQRLSWLGNPMLSPTGEGGAREGAGGDVAAHHAAGTASASAGRTPCRGHRDTVGEAVDGGGPGSARARRRHPAAVVGGHDGGTPPPSDRRSWAHQRQSAGAPWDMAEALWGDEWPSGGLCDWSFACWQLRRAASGAAPAAVIGAGPGLPLYRLEAAQRLN